MKIELCLEVYLWTEFFGILDEKEDSKSWIARDYAASFVHTAASASNAEIRGDTLWDWLRTPCGTLAQSAAAF